MTFWGDVMVERKEEEEKKEKEKEKKEKRWESKLLRRFGGGEAGRVGKARDQKTTKQVFEAGSRFPVLEYC